MFKNTALALIIAAATSLSAQADPLERYSELQAVVEAVNDPDPLMRLALLEAVIAKGDATEVQLAIRTAFTIDDPNIRSLALRTHFASFQTILITADYPADIQKILDSGDSKAIAAAQEAYNRQFIFMDFLAGVFTYRTDYTAGDNEFKVYSLNARETPDEKNFGHGNIKGAIVTLQAPTHLQYTHSLQNCTFEFLDYVGFTLKGTASCDFDDTLPFPVTMHLFEPDPAAS